LTNTWLTLSRERLKGNTDTNDWRRSIQVLGHALYQLVIIAAPLMPLTSEYCYQQIIKTMQNTDIKSVHYHSYPAIITVDQQLNVDFNIMQDIMKMVLQHRGTHKLSRKYPIAKISIGINNSSELSHLTDLIKQATNVMDIEFIDFGDMIQYRTIPQFKEIGQVLRDTGLQKHTNRIGKLITDLALAETMDFVATERYTDVSTGTIFGTKQIKLEISLIKIIHGNSFMHKNGTNILINTEFSQTAENIYRTRLIGSAINMHRKSAGLKTWQKVDMVLNCDQELIEFIIDNKCLEKDNINTVVWTTHYNNSTSHRIADYILTISTCVVN
jgi:isoleucyl-tRNA synthetase